MIQIEENGTDESSETLMVSLQRNFILRLKENDPEVINYLNGAINLVTINAGYSSWHYFPGYSLDDLSASVRITSEEESLRRTIVFVV